MMGMRTRLDNDEEDEHASSGRRPIWSGAIAFGIVSIAVRMFPAIREHDLHFHQISRKDRKRIRYLKVAEGDNEEVPATDIVKGYQIADGTYVTFDDGELERLAARKSRVIDIEAFVALAEIDPRHFNRPYYLLPTDEAAGKPYRLLVETLTQRDRVGIARVVMHNKEHLVALRSIAGVLCLETLHFSDEIVDPDDLRPDRRRPVVGTRELKMAEQLVTALSAPFDPTAYHDTYRQRLRAAIGRKAKGRTMQIEETEPEADQGKVLDLMDALRRSVARTHARAPSRPGAARRRAQKAG